MDRDITAIKQLNTMILLTIGTQIFILAQNAIVAYYFGVSDEIDAFNLTKNISNFVFSFIGAGISTIIIPFLKEKYNKKSLDIFISVIYLFSILLLVIMILFRDPIILITSGSTDSLFLNIASKVFYFTIISAFLNSLIQLAKAILEFNGYFNVQKLIVLFVTVLLVFILILGKDVSIYYYAVLVLGTTFLSVVFHFFFLRRINYKYSISFDLTNNNFKGMVRLLIPTVLSTGVYQISLLIDTMIASRLDSGSISLLSYSNSIIGMVNMLLLGNLTSFAYPRLVKKTNELDRQNSLVEYILLVNTIMCVFILLFLLVGREGISILFERGNFTDENTRIVYICSIIFAVALPINGIRDLLYRYFYINKDTYTPFINSIIISILNIITSIILASYIGIYGVIAGTVVASYMSLFLISLKFKKKFPILYRKKFLIIENFKVILATILTVIITLLLKNIIALDSIIFAMFLYSSISLLIFFTLLKVIKSKVFKLNL